MGWITVSPGPDNTVQLTELGRVLLRGLEAEGLAESSEWRVADVVLEPTDSLVYVHLTRVVANAGAGLLVDGYFKPEYVPWLVETTTLRRVLVSSRHRGAADDLKRMAVALATVPNAATLEVRETNSVELHDRCLVRADGTHPVARRISQRCRQEPDRGDSAGPRRDAGLSRSIRKPLEHRHGRGAPTSWDCSSAQFRSLMELASAAWRV